jgi:hypothetical protein
MIIVYGTRCYGRADVIEGVGHVTCRFVHIMFVPLVPIETMFMVGEEGGIKLPFSFKAAASGWLRGGAILTGLGMLVGAVASFVDGEPLLGAACLVVAVIAFGAFPMFGMLFGSCSPMRRAEIMSMLGLSAGEAQASHAPAYAPGYGPAHAPPHAPPAYGPAYAQNHAPPYGYGHAHPHAQPQGQWPVHHPQPQPALPPPAGGFGAPPAYGPGPHAHGAPQPYGAPQQAHFGPPQGYGPPGWDPNRR